VRRVVYVACDAPQALPNILELCKPRTNNRKGEPFRLVRAAAVDMFPHTDKMEVAFLLERT
jgi:tRNA (uracil-5-)-methyltransferase